MSQEPLKLLHVISSMNPLGGGPSEGIRNLHIIMSTMGHITECVTSDDPSGPWLSRQLVKIHATGPGRGAYAYNPRLGRWLESHAHEYDIVIINGLWQHHGVSARKILIRLGIPYVVFTHGMLDPWFKYTYPLKHLKKWLYWPLGEYRVIRDARAVLFTCEEERLLARKSFWLYTAKEIVVNYGTRIPQASKDEQIDAFFGGFPDLRNKRLFTFLSRIHEKKGCDLLIDAFATVCIQDPQLHLVMVGPDQAGLMANLKRQAEALGIADRITWTGMLEGDMKWGVLHASEVFVLPSHQENFGIAVAEALGCGLPVLISDKINIWREIEADGAGIVESDTRHGAEQMLQRWMALDNEARRAMSIKAYATFNNRFTIQAAATSLTAALRKVLQ